MTTPAARGATTVLPTPVAGVLEWCLLREAAPAPDSRQRGRAVDAGTDQGRGRRGGDRAETEPAADRRGERRGETLSDVDLLVHPDHMRHASRLLAEAGFVERPAWGRGSHRFFYRYDPHTGSWLKLDIVTEVAFGGRQEFATGLARGVLDRAGPDARPAPQDEFWILLLHCLLDRSGVTGRHAQRLGELRPQAQGPGDVRDLVDGLLGAAGTAALLADVAALHGDLAAHAGPLRRRWRRRRPVSIAARRLWALGARAGTKALTAWRRRGVAVAVVGPDGAGKSSVVTSLIRTYPFPVVSYYAGQYQDGGGMLSRLPGGHSATLLLRQARVSLATLRHTVRGRVVVFDRYAYDSRLARPGASVKTRVRRAVLGRAALRPRLVVVLDAPGEVLFARSGEHSAAALEDQRGRYAALASSEPGWLVVDATRSPDDVRREVTAQVWAGHAGRWRAPGAEHHRAPGTVRARSAGAERDR